MREMRTARRDKPEVLSTEDDDLVTSKKMYRRIAELREHIRHPEADFDTRKELTKRMERICRLLNKNKKGKKEIKRQALLEARNSVQRRRRCLPKGEGSQRPLEAP